MILLVLPLGIAIRRSTELFVLRVEHGRAELVRGRLPHSLLAELQDVFERSQDSGRVRVTLERGIAEIQVKGEISSTTLQQLRNVIGTVPVQRIRSGGVKR